MIELQITEINPPQDCNLILGQAHFIKTAEDLYEALVNAVPNIKFGLAFCEASGPCLVRHEGNDPDLKQQAAQIALELACGHIFIIFIKEAYPLNVLDKIKSVPETCNIYAATANPLQVITAETKQGKGIMGVIDGQKTKGIETQQDINQRKQFLRNIGYKK